MTKEEERKSKAKALRYKKAIVSGLSLDTLEYDLMEIKDACYDIQWAQEADLVEQLLGEDEAAEFKMMFSALENDLERFENDIQECWVPECYEDLMVAVAGGKNTEVLGWDVVESDYFGLESDYETHLAMEEAGKRLKRLTKDELIQASQQCFLVAFNYIGLRNRYNELKASIDVLTGETKGLLKTITEINEAHEKAYSGESYKRWVNWGRGYPTDEMRAFDRLLEQFDPYDRIWIE